MSHTEAVKRVRAAWEAFLMHDGDAECGEMEKALEAIELSQSATPASASGERCTHEWHDIVGDYQCSNCGVIKGTEELRAKAEAYAATLPLASMTEARDYCLRTMNEAIEENTRLRSATATQFEAVGWWTGKEAKFEPGKIPPQGGLLFRPVSTSTKEKG